MRRVKTYLRTTTRTERLSALGLMHPYKGIAIDGRQWLFALKHNRVLISNEHQAVYSVATVYVVLRLRINKKVNVE